MRYIDIIGDKVVGKPYAHPSTMPVEAADGNIAFVGSAHWQPADFLPFGKVPVEGKADPATEVETGYTYDAAAGIARPIIAARPLVDVQTEAIAAIKAEASRLIGASGHDAYAARQVTTGKPVPAAILAYAEAVRAASNDAEAAVRTSADVYAISKLPPPAWPALS